MYKIIKTKVHIHKNKRIYCRFIKIINSQSNNMRPEKCMKKGGYFTNYSTHITRRNINVGNCRYQRDIFNSINRRRKDTAMNKRRRTYNDITQKTKEQTRGNYLELKSNSGTSQG